LEPCIVSLSSRIFLAAADVKYGEILGADEVDARPLLFRHWLAGNLEALFQPLLGGVALVESPAETTSGIAATFCRS